MKSHVTLHVKASAQKVNWEDQVKPGILRSSLGSLRNDEGYGIDNAKKQ